MEKSATLPADSLTGDTLADVVANEFNPVGTKDVWVRVARLWSDAEIRTVAGPKMYNIIRKHYLLLLRVNPRAELKDDALSFFKQNWPMRSPLSVFQKSWQYRLTKKNGPKRKK